MRREALARWLNLSVIAAIIAVLTLVLVSAPPRTAFALDRCGSEDDSPAPSEDTTFTLSGMFPISGQPLTDVGFIASFADYTDGATVDQFRLIANPASSDPYVLEAFFSDNLTNWLVDFRIPVGTPADSLTLSVCYAIEDGSGVESWFYSANELVFTVEELEVCQPDWEGMLNPFPSTSVTPDMGSPGDFFQVSAAGGSIPVEEADWIQVIWDWNGPSSTDPATGLILFQGPHTSGNQVLISDLQVPADANVGEHELTICYLTVDGGFFAWWYTMLPPDPPPDGIQGVPSYTVLQETADISTCSDEVVNESLGLSYSDEELLHSGPPGTNDEAIIFIDGEGALGTEDYRLVWDFGSVAPFVLNSTESDDETSLSLPFIVPYDATAGLHTIGVCYLVTPTEGAPYWVSAANTIQFNVQSPVPCGTVANIGETNPIGLTPNQGPSGSTFLATISAVEMGLEDALLVQVIWDWVPGNGDNIPPGGQVIAQITKDDSDDEAQVTATVPTAAVPGPHNVNICYYVPFDLATQGGFGTAVSVDGEWIAGESSIFNVVEPGSSTPTPPTSTPILPTSTPTPPTATTEPDDEEPPPTLTPTPTVPIVPIFGPPVSPTVIGNVARTGPEMTQTALASLPETPGPGTPNGGGGGGGTTPSGGGGGTGGGGTIINPNSGAQETTTPGTGTPAASATPAPTATRGPATPTPTQAATQTMSPASDVQGSRTEWVQSVKGMQDITDDFDVILTNVLLTGLLLLLIFLTSEIFNQTIRDNQVDVESWMRNFFGPVIGIWGGLSAMMGTATLGNQKLKDLAWLGIVLLVTVLIEGFLEPGFGFNKASVLLFLSLLVAVGFVTYLTEGGEAFVARSFFGQSTAVRVFPAAIGIALVCVIMSRLGGFIPGILYGFVGTAVFLRPSTLNADQTGKMIFLPMAIMLAISVGAWMLVDQFRGPDASDFDVFVEGVLIGIFVATIEGVAINMLPIAYMDGRKLIDWNPIIWIATAGVALFLLWTVLINDERAYFDSLQETTSQVALIAVVFCFGLSILTWLWFRYRPGGHA